MFLIVSVLSFLYCFTYETDKKIKKNEITFLIIDVVGLIGLLYNKNHTIADLILLFAWQNMGILFYFMYKTKNFKINRNFAIISTVYLGMLIYIVQSQYETGWIMISDRLGSNSTSIVLLEFFIIDEIYRYSIHKKTNYLFAFICFLITLIAGGIAGVVTFSFLIIILWLFENEKLSVNLIKCVIFILISACILLYINDGIEKILNYINQGDSESRILMLQQYFALMKENIFNFIFGANIQTSYLLRHYENLHNCFFNWHYYYGIIPMLYFGGIVVYILYKSIKERNTLYVILMVTTVIRSLTDETTFAFIPIWIFFFLIIVEKKNIKFVYSNRAKNKLMEDY